MAQNPWVDLEATNPVSLRLVFYKPNRAQHTKLQQNKQRGTEITGHGPRDGTRTGCGDRGSSFSLLLCLLGRAHNQQFRKKKRENSQYCCPCNRQLCIYRDPGEDGGSKAVGGTAPGPSVREGRAGRVPRGTPRGRTG